MGGTAATCSTAPCRACGSLRGGDRAGPVAGGSVRARCDGREHRAGRSARVLWTDPVGHAFAMELLPPRLRNWKQDLMSGRIDPATASRAGQLLGQLHARSAGRPDLPSQLQSPTRQDSRPLLSVRHRTVQPALDETYGRVCWTSAERSAFLWCERARV